MARTRIDDREVLVEFALFSGPAPARLRFSRVPGLGEWLWHEGDWWEVRRVLWNHDGPETAKLIVGQP